MPTHKVVTINPNPKYPANKSPRFVQLIEIIKLHGPQFRIPEDAQVELPDAHHHMHPNAKIVPVCALRDNWVAFFYSDEITME
jgi:hypothetical protein